MLSEIRTLMVTIENQIIWPELATGQLIAVILLITFSLLVTIESNFPHKPFPAKPLRQSYASNIGLFLFNSLIVSFLTAMLALFVSAHFSGLGLLSFINNPVGRVIVAFLVMDLMLYLWHMACHRFSGLWLFHRVHHSDPVVNVSTAFRIHIAEMALTTVLKSIYLIVLGLDKTLMLLIDALFAGFIMFHHCNMTFQYEHWLGKLIIVPHLHRAHHSTERSQHDHNYGAVLSIWDRLFGTLIEQEPKAMGIKIPSPTTTLGLICFGFGYAPKVAVTLDNATNPVVENLDAMIAEAAYYKAEKRAFSPGYELSDWLEAKKEILRLVYGNQKCNVGMEFTGGNHI